MLESDPFGGGEGVLWGSFEFLTVLVCRCPQVLKDPVGLEDVPLGLGLDSRWEVLAVGVGDWRQVPQVAPAGDPSAVVDLDIGQLDHLRGFENVAEVGPLVPDVDDVRFRVAADAGASQRPADHLPEQDSAGCRACQQHRLGGRQIDAFGQHPYRHEHRLAGLVLKPFQDFRAADVRLAMHHSGWNIGESEETLQAVGVSDCSDKHQALAVLVSVVQVGLNHDTVAMGAVQILQQLR